IQLNVAQADITVEAKRGFFRSKVQANIESLVGFCGVINFRRNEISAGNNIRTSLVGFPNTFTIGVVLRQLTTSNSFFQQTFSGEDKTITRNRNHTTAMEVSPIDIFEIALKALIQISQPKSPFAATWAPLSTQMSP